MKQRPGGSPDRDPVPNAKSIRRLKFARRSGDMTETFVPKGHGRDWGLWDSHTMVPRMRIRNHFDSSVIGNW